MKLRNLLLPMAVVGCLMTGPALADSFTYTSFSVNPGLPVTLNDPTLGVNETVQGGEITLNGSGTLNGMSITQLMAWCVDIIAQLQPTGTYNIVPFSSGSPGNGNPALTGTQVTEMASMMLAVNNPLDDNPLATQLAIWRLEYGPDLTFSSSNSIVDTDITTSLVLATDASVGGSLFNANAKLDLLDVPLADQALAIPFASPVPEPSSVLLLGSGLIVLGFLKWRREAVRA